jgi:hypothetical protein
MRFLPIVLSTIFCISQWPVLYAQSAQPSAPVPRLINLNGTFRPADRGTPASEETVTLSVYSEEFGGDPLWQETQTVQIASNGRYNLLLGQTQADGVPLDLFASGEARWLGMLWARPGEVEGPRNRLTSVPYALRAVDADTLGGKPASAYLLAPTGGSEGTRTVASTTAPELSSTGGLTAAVVLPGTGNQVAKYVNETDLGASALYESGGSVGINTTSPFDALHVRFTDTNGGLTGYAVQNLGSSPTSYSGMLFYDQNGALGQFQGFNNATHEYRINNIAKNGSNVFDGSINFMLGGNSRFVVKNTGIGMGTTTPTLPLDVVGSVGSTAYSGGFGFGGSFIGRGARGTIAAPSFTMHGDTLAHFGGAGYQMNLLGTGFTGPKAGMSIIAEGTWNSTSSLGASIAFNTTDSSFSGGLGHTVMTLAGSQATVNGNLLVVGHPPPFLDPPDATVSSTSLGGAGVFSRIFDENLPGAAPGFVGQRGRLSGGTPSTTLAGDTLVVFRGVGSDANGFPVDGAEIAVVAAADFGAQIRFRTTPFIFSGPMAERMIITQSGDVGIGTLSPADKLQVVGDLRIGTFGTNGCLRRFDGGTITGTCSSDARFKKDITSFPRSLESVAALRPVHYWWRSAEFPDQHFGETRTYGLIAQDVERVLPELVNTNEDGYKAVDYGKLPLLTIQAVKELKAENDALKVRIAQLEALERRVAELERLLEDRLLTPERR